MENATLHTTSWISNAQVARAHHPDGKPVKNRAWQSIFKTRVENSLVAVAWTLDAGFFCSPVAAVRNPDCKPPAEVALLG